MSPVSAEMLAAAWEAAHGVPGITAELVIRIYEAMRAAEVAGSEAKSRALKAARQARWREKKAKASTRPSTKASTASTKTPTVAPEGVREETWLAWRRHRGGKLTPEAEKRQRKKLGEWRAAGLDVDAIVDRSIEQGWAGLFVIDAQKPLAGRNEARAATAAAIYGGNGHEPINGTAERIG